MWLDRSVPKVWTIEGFLSPARCQALIEQALARGCAPAPITTMRGPVMNTDIRNNTRVMWDDLPLVAELFEALRPHMPARVDAWELLSLNERWRVYRYEPGQRFALHRDGSFLRSPSEQSLFTFMVYLNEGFEGGETTFPYEDRVIVPATGRALLFQHQLLHEGTEVRRGEKFVLRTDVMYRLAKP